MSEAAAAALPVGRGARLERGGGGPAAVAASSECAPAAQRGSLRVHSAGAPAVSSGAVVRLPGMCRLTLILLGEYAIPHHAGRGGMEERISYDDGSISLLVVRTVLVCLLICISEWR